MTDPSTFELDADGIVTLLADRLEGEAQAKAMNAVLLCPSQALSILEE